MTNHLTDEQRERIARAMGWAYTPIEPAGWWRADDRPECEGADHWQQCPRYDEPGELHEELVAKYSIEGEWEREIYCARARDLPVSEPWADDKRRPIAECLAVLAYEDWKEGEK